MLNRRSFLQTTSATAAGIMLAPYLSTRGVEAYAFEPNEPLILANAIRLNRNENSNGAGTSALNGIASALSEANRYPDTTVTKLQLALAKQFSLTSENVVLGCGSTDILVAAVAAFTDASHGLVTCLPGFETPAVIARLRGAPVKEIPVTGDLKLDLDAMATAARGAGLVYLCNPNNPTSTVHGANRIQAFVARVQKESPNTTILIDEAYHEYVDDPSYATSIPIAMKNPRVFIARTFSKVYGLAGLRIGYALGDAATMKKLAPHTLEMSVNQLAAGAALGTLGDRARVEQQQKLNRTARSYITKEIGDLGYRVADSQANFIMVDLKKNAQPFRDACAKRGVLVGRPFPPLDNHVRISIGTPDEMKRAMDVFRPLLSTSLGL